MPEIQDLGPEGPTYSTLVGAAYVFNLIVGTGALTIPAAFSHAGWLMGVIVITILACIGYLTATFVVEAMSSANAVLHYHQRKLKQIQVDVNTALESSNNPVLESEARTIDRLSTEQDVNDETVSLLRNSDAVNENEARGTQTNFFSLQRRVEMGQMASLFFNRGGLLIFYATICIYLYGDLSIYGTAVSKTLRDITCTFVGPNDTCNGTALPSEQCWPGVSVSRENAYRIFLAIFILATGSFVFFDVQKTKLLQIFTTLLRWLAFGLMVALACSHLAGGRGRGHPPTFQFLGLPNLFGVCIYSFMCHHSLPALVTPLASKRGIHRMLAVNYAAILVFYLLVALTGVFSFASLRDLYTLNFEPDPCGGSGDPDLPTSSPVAQYFLSLFPVFTLSTNFPIIAITLRNNMTQFWRLLASGSRSVRPGAMWTVERVVLPLLAVLPPACVSLATEDVQMLVGVTGSFGGMAIQYIVPTLLVYYSRKATAGFSVAGGIEGRNPHRSPFSHGGWIVFTLVWTLACLIMIVTNYILGATHK